jgi:hypothetical protein
MMTSEMEIKDFKHDFEVRFDALVRWAMENWPDKKNPLSVSDFSEMREAISIIGTVEGRAKDEELEPEKGGPQYVSVDPTPWP